MTNDKLELISLAKEFEVKHIIRDTMEESGYEISFVDDDKDLTAFISEDGDIQYFLSGCYNSGCDWLEIDPGEFDKLRDFCTRMTR